jgi:hypothetical protein
MIIPSFHPAFLNPIFIQCENKLFHLQSPLYTIQSSDNVNACTCNKKVGNQSIYIPVLLLYCTTTEVCVHVHITIKKKSVSQNFILKANKFLHNAHFLRSTCERKTIAIFFIDTTNNQTTMVNSLSQG